MFCSGTPRQLLASAMQLAVSVSMGLLPHATAVAQDFTAVDKVLTKSVSKGDLTLRQASLMMRTLRESARKDANRTPTREVPRREASRRPTARRSARYSKFDLAAKSHTIGGLIAAALDQETSLRFKNATLADAVNFIAETHDLPIEIKELKLTPVDATKKVSIDLSRVSLRSALRLTLAPLELTYLVKDQTLWITTRADAERLLSAEYLKVLTPDQASEAAVVQKDRQD